MNKVDTKEQIKQVSKPDDEAPEEEQSAVELTKLITTDKDDKTVTEDVAAEKMKTPPRKVEDQDEKEKKVEKLSASEEHRKELAKAEEVKLKSMNAWGDTGEKKSFGLKGFFKFTWPRVWTGGCWRKFMVCVNIFMMLGYKASATLVPLLLKEVIDSMTCDEDKLTKEAFDKSKTDQFLLRANESCPSE